eukprot:1708342-Pleurochrysis_carterae.AAC.1
MRNLVGALEYSRVDCAEARLPSLAPNESMSRVWPRLAEVNFSRGCARPMQRIEISHMRISTN